jgi:hypothetical protein
MMRRIFVVLTFLLLAAFPAGAVTCNPPSGWLLQNGQINIGDSVIFGPSCGFVQSSGGSTISGPVSSVINDIAIWRNTLGSLIGDATGYNLPPGGPLTITTAQLSPTIENGSNAGGVLPILNNTLAATPVGHLFQENGSNKWFVGKQFDLTYVIKDLVNNLEVIKVTAGGPVALANGPLTITTAQLSPIIENGSNAGGVLPILNNTFAATPVGHLFQENGSNKWFAGKQSDLTYVIKDLVNNLEVIKVSAGGPVAINSLANSDHLGLLVTQSGPTSGTDAGTCGGNLANAFCFNLINITSDQTNPIGASSETMGLAVFLTTGGSNAQGTKNAGLFFLTRTAADSGVGFPDDIGMNVGCRSSSSNGGTNTGAGARGTCFALGPASVLLSGATNYFEVSAGEADCGIKTGASVRFRFCWSIVDIGDLQAAGLDAALEIGAVGSTPGFKTGILFSSTHGGSPIGANGTAIGTDGIGLGANLTDIINFSPWTCNGNYLAFNNFVVNCAGHANAIAGYQGVATNSNATAGDIGEFISSSIASGSGVSLTTATAANITSVSLTAGDWDCRGSGYINSDAASVMTALVVWTSTTSATLPTAPNNGGENSWVGTASGPGTLFPSAVFPSTRFSLASTTTVYLSAYLVFSAGTNKAYGFIGCRRMR